MCVEVGHHLACDEDVFKTVRAVSLQGLNPATPSEKYDPKLWLRNQWLFNGALRRRIKQLLSPELPT